MSILLLTHGHRVLLTTIDRAMTRAGFRRFADLLNNAQVHKDIMVVSQRQKRNRKQVCPFNPGLIYDENGKLQTTTLQAIDNNMAVHMLKHVNVLRMEVLATCGGQFAEDIETLRRVRAKLFRDSVSSRMSEDDFRSEWIAVSSAILRLSRYDSDDVNDSLIQEMRSILQSTASNVISEMKVCFIEF